MKIKSIITITVVFAMLLIGLAIVFPKISEKYEKTKVGKTNKISATDFTVYDKDGKGVKLSDKKGKPVVVNFWATWCGYCVNELPDFDKLYEEYKDKVVFMMVDLPDGQNETKSGALSFVKQEGFSFPVYFDSDGSARKAYVENGIPVTIFIDKNGNLYNKNIGMMHESTIREYLDAMIGEN